MSIETRFEIINAVINNPLEAVVLFVVAFILWKFFFGNSWMARDNRFEIKQWFWWRGRHTSRWLQKRTYKQFMIIYFSTFPALIIYSGYKIMFEWTGTGKVQYGQEITFGLAVLFPTAFMIFTLVTYFRRRKIKNEGNKVS